MTYLDLEATVAPDVELDPKYTSVVIDRGDHEMLPRFAPKWQRRVAAPRLDAGDWLAVVMLDGDQVLGHFWLVFRDATGLFNGIPNVRLREDEGYGFDLYLAPEYRRGSIGQWAAKLTIEAMRDRGVRIGYTHVTHDNAGSVIWHHGLGFNWVQVYNYLEMGPRVCWKLPKSESPMYGPLSSKGRHSEENPELPFGGQLLPQ